MELVEQAFNYGIGLGGVLAFGALVWAGFQYVVAAGNPSQQSDARDRAVQAILGLLLLFFSVFVLQLVSGRGTDITKTIIPKLPVKLEPMEAP